MYNQIVNPATGRKVNVDGKIGKQVLQQYKEQLGGERTFFGRELNMPKFLGKKKLIKLNTSELSEGIKTKAPELLKGIKTPNLIEQFQKYMSNEMGKNYNIHEEIRNIIKAVCANNKNFFLVDKKSNVNINCYEREIILLQPGFGDKESIDSQFWNQFIDDVHDSTIGRKLLEFIEKHNTSKSDFHESIKIYSFRNFRIVKLKDGKKGVYRSDCRRSNKITMDDRKAYLSGASKSLWKGTKDKGSSIMSGLRSTGTGIMNLRTQEGRAENLEALKKMRRSMSTSIKESGEKAKQGFVSVNNRYFGKSTYVKNLIKQIQDLKNKSIDLEKEIKPNKHNHTPQIRKKITEYKEIRKQEQEKLKELQDIDKKYVAVTKQGYLALPIKNSYCDIKTTLENDKLTDICSCNRVIFDRRPKDVDQQFKERHEDAKLEQISKELDSKSVAADSQNPILFESSITLVGGKRNAKRTSKKRNASKKRHNTSKNNNRR